MDAMESFIVVYKFNWDKHQETKGGRVLNVNPKLISFSYYHGVVWLLKLIFYLFLGLILSDKHSKTTLQVFKELFL